MLIRLFREALCTFIMFKNIFCFPGTTGFTSTSNILAYLNFFNAAFCLNSKAVQYDSPTKLETLRTVDRFYRGTLLILFRNFWVRVTLFWNFTSVILDPHFKHFFAWLQILLIVATDQRVSADTFKTIILCFFFGFHNFSY